MQWRHEWRWLQATHARPSADYPFYFSHGNRSRRGQFEHGQRELYVSAYLRTLAYASLRGVISYAEAEQHSMLGLTMNRGLADLQPVQRPDWVQNLQSRSSAGTQELARELWANANAGTGSCEVPIFLRALDANDSEFMEYELNMTVVPSGLYQIRNRTGSTRPARCERNPRANDGNYRSRRRDLPFHHQASTCVVANHNSGLCGTCSRGHGNECPTCISICI